MNKKRTDEEKGRMQYLRNRGKTYREIAEEMGIPIDAVNYFCSTEIYKRKTL